VQEIRAVLFDAGNTLVFVDPVRMLHVVRELGVDADELRIQEAERRARLHLMESVHGGARGGTEDHVWREYFMNLLRWAGVPADLEAEAGSRLRAVHEAEHLWTYVAAETPDALRRVSASGYRMAVVSNADGRVEALLGACGIAEHFEFIIDSHLFGAEKPDPRIFLAAVDRLGLPAEACLYVGDLYPIDVIGARAAGLQAVLLDPWGTFDVDVDRIPSVAALPEYLGARSAPSVGT
jgi:putative hydrolase of the HAD superfamily